MPFMKVSEIKDEEVLSSTVVVDLELANSAIVLMIAPL